MANRSISEKGDTPDSNSLCRIVSSRLLFLFVIIFVIACRAKPEHPAPDRNFYFEVKSNSSSVEVDQYRKYLLKNIPKHKYSITNASGQAWPFYQSFDLDEAVAQDSLMPPHWFIHKMIPFNDQVEIKEDEFLVTIEIFVLPDTVPNYGVSVFRKQGNELTLSGSSGTHFIEPSEYQSEAELPELFLKHTVRYSFK